MNTTTTTYTRVETVLDDLLGTWDRSQHGWGIEWTEAPEWSADLDWSVALDCRTVVVVDESDPGNGGSAHLVDLADLDDDHLRDEVLRLLDGAPEVDE